MPSFVNSYSPLTPVGSSLQNIALAFLGDNPRNRQKAEMDAALNAARIQQAEAAAAKSTAEAGAIEAARTGRADFLPNMYASLVPESDRQAARNFITNEPVMAFNDMRQPRPDSLSPDVESQLRRAHTVGPMIQAGSPTSKVDDLAKAFGLVQEQGFADQTARGDMSPTRFMQLGRKNPYGIQGDTLVNLAEGFLGPTTQLGNAKIDTQRTAQDENRAQAGAAGASAGASNARTRLTDAQRARVEAGTDTPLEPVQTDAGVVLQPRTKAVGAQPGAKPKAAAADKSAMPKAPSGPLLKGVEDVIAQEEAANGKFDQLTRRGIKARATTLMNDPKSPTHNNPAGSVEAAISEGGEFSGGKRMILPDQPRTRAPQAKAPAAGGAGKGTRPAGATDKQLLDEANAAISKGADRNKVMQRLADMGVRVN